MHFLPQHASAQTRPVVSGSARIMLSASRPQSKPDAPKGGEGTDLFLVSILHSLANFSFFCPLRQQSGFCTVEFANWLVELELELVEFEFNQPDKSDKSDKTPALAWGFRLLSRLESKLSAQLSAAIGSFWSSIQASANGPLEDI